MRSISYWPKCGRLWTRTWSEAWLWVFLVHRERGAGFMSFAGPWPGRASAAGRCALSAPPTVIVRQLADSVGSVGRAFARQNPAQQFRGL